MDLDFLLDSGVWDGVESVGLEIARAGANQADAVPVAKRRALTQREAAASGGVYTTQDVVWLIPQSALTPGTVPKPADVVIDADGVRHTVLDLRWGKARQTWRLTTRSLVLAYQLQDTVYVERAALSYDAAGAAVKAFPPAGGFVLATLAARVQDQQDAVADGRGIRGTERRYDVIVERLPPGLNTAEDRVRWVDPTDGSTAYLDVVTVEDAARIDLLPVLHTIRRP